MHCDSTSNFNSARRIGAGGLGPLRRCLLTAKGPQHVKNNSGRRGLVGDCFSIDIVASGLILLSMTRDYILVSPTPSACLKPGTSSDLRPSLGLRPSDLGDAAALTAPRHSQQKKCAFLPSTS